MQLHRFAFALGIAQKRSVRAEETVLEQQNQHLRSELEAKRKLEMQLVDAVEEQDKGGGG